MQQQRQPTTPTSLNPPSRQTSPPQIVDAVAPVRERLDACVIFPSMPAVMKLNKLGTFNMAQLGQSKSMIGEFIKWVQRWGGGGRQQLLLDCGSHSGQQRSGG